MTEENIILVARVDSKILDEYGIPYTVYHPIKVSSGGLIVTMIEDINIEETV